MGEIDSSQASGLQALRREKQDRDAESGKQQVAHLLRIAAAKRAE